MPGWRRNRPTGAPADRAVPPPARPRDEWRALPPLPTVLRSPVTTAAVSAFSGSLSSWHDPSFLARLGHHIDPDGPAGLVTGLDQAPESPEPPLTHHHDRPLPAANGALASLQRTVACWLPHPARSRLVTASSVDLSPLPRHAVSATAGQPIS